MAESLHIYLISYEKKYISGTANSNKQDLTRFGKDSVC